MTTSWVIIASADNRAIFETWSEKTAKAINTKKYKAIPIKEYLSTLNAQIKKENNHGLDIHKRKNRLKKS